MSAMSWGAFKAPVVFGQWLNLNLGTAQCHQADSFGRSVAQIQHAPRVKRTPVSDAHDHLLAAGYPAHTHI